MAGKTKRLKVTFQDGRTFDVKVPPRAQVNAERHFGRSLLSLDKVEEAYYLGWCAMTVAGLTHGSFDEFLDVLEDVDASKEDAVATPTVATPLPDTSSD